MQEAGSLIDRIDRAMRLFRAEYESTLKGTSADYERYLGADTRARALKVLDEQELEHLCSVIENFFYWWETPDGITASSGYVAAFLMVREKLEQTLQTAASKLWQQPGWDNTVFGYVAKTCRDREFLSSGPIPGHCIIRAHLVDQDGHTLKTYWSTSPA